MVILSPVIYWLVKKIKVIFIILLFVIYALDIKVSWMSGTFTMSCFFFSLGAYFAIKKQDFTSVLWRYRYLIIPITVFLMIYQTYSGSAMGDTTSMMIHPWLVIFQSFALIIVASYLCKYPNLYDANKKLSKTSFFIYALHTFILGYIISMIKKVMPMQDTWYMMTFIYLTAPLLCVALCIGIYWMCQKFMPGVLRVIVGERLR